jgi:hypothetical protein
VAQEGAQLLARFPAYLAQRRAVLDECSTSLITPLQAIVGGYMELATTEQIWATGLGTAS